MTEAELREKLRRELGATVNTSVQAPKGRCQYCGAWTLGRACRSCRDLVQKDPNRGGVPW